MASEVVLSLDAVKVRPGGSDFALDVTFALPNGITVLFGPSGSGKSTTLSLICGLMQAESGRIVLGDRVLADASKRLHLPPESRGVAIVFQSLALFPHLSALDNVAFGLARSIERKDRRNVARSWLERMKVPHLAERRPRTFSGGEAQRVALARALASSPRALLLDEPFSALDEDLRVELRREVRALVQELEIPTLFVTHDRSEARALGERAVVLREGRVVSSGSVAEVLGRE